MKRFLTSAAAFLLAVGASRVSACQCGHATLEEQVDNADLVFVARITETLDTAPSSESVQEANNKGHNSVHAQYFVQAEFRVTERIKGNPESISHLTTGYGGGDCGVGFLPGHSYLVMADATGVALIVWAPGASR